MEAELSGALTPDIQISAVNRVDLVGFVDEGELGEDVALAGEAGSHACVEAPVEDGRRLGLGGHRSGGRLEGLHSVSWSGTDSHCPLLLQTARLFRDLPAGDHKLTTSPNSQVSNRKNTTSDDKHHMTRNYTASFVFELPSFFVADGMDMFLFL